MTPTNATFDLDGSIWIVGDRSSSEHWRAELAYFVTSEPNRPCSYGPSAGLGEVVCSGASRLSDFYRPDLAVASCVVQACENAWW